MGLSEEIAEIVRLQHVLRTLTNDGVATYRHKHVSERCAKHLDVATARATLFGLKIINQFGVNNCTANLMISRRDQHSLLKSVVRSQSRYATATSNYLVLPLEAPPLAPASRAFWLPGSKDPDEACPPRDAISRCAFTVSATELFTIRYSRAPLRGLMGRWTNLLVRIHAGEAARVVGFASLGTNFADLLLGAERVLATAGTGSQWPGALYRLAKLPGLVLPVSAIVFGGVAQSL